MIGCLSHTSDRPRRLLCAAVSVCLVVALLLKICVPVEWHFLYPCLSDYAFSEFLINLSGGFVRRGLPGELLFRLCEATGLSPAPVILGICVVAYLAVNIFFFKRFHTLKYCWWLILSPLFLGYVFDVIRKDFLLYGLFILSLWVVRKDNPSALRSIVALLIAAVALLWHEAYMFWGVPVLALRLWRLPGKRVLNRLGPGCLIALFALLCFFKGDTATASAITGSWNNLLPGSPLNQDPLHNNAINALGWGASETFFKHFCINASIGGQGYCVLLLTLAGGYYLFTNFMYLMRTRGAAPREEDRTLTGALYLLAVLTMIPMFTVLSVDTSRLLQSVSVACITPFVIFPAHTLRTLLPAWLRRWSVAINRAVNRRILPTRTLIVVLLMLLAGAVCGYDPVNAFGQSAVCQVWRCFKNPLMLIINALC